MSGRDHLDALAVAPFAPETDAPDPLAEAAPRGIATQTPVPVELEVDGDRVVVEARRQLVLRCGKSSITLHEDGRIEIRGVDLVSRASGRNRILGSSIDLN
ncbi:hypothetical protein [Roseateles sp. YR242]|uniref:hypothetical protein n=1 Tax=Roseateles sp. YR242 TaxID=1855305 RepID=UPI000B857BBF|nr:hypothetical protein [Roseateles sp. YR242]